MNEVLGKPKFTRKESLLKKRTTIVTPPVEHTLSEYNSVPGSSVQYCYIIKPNRDDCWYRRYSCVSCAKCKALQFVKPGKPVCDNVYCGEFKPLRFKRKSQNALKKQRLQAQKKQKELKKKLKRKASNPNSKKKKKKQN